MSRPADCQRHMCAIVVDIALAAGKRHAVIAGHHNDGIFQLPCLPKHLDEFTGFSVIALHFKIIIRDVAAHVRCIRETGRNFNLIQRDAAFRTGISHIPPVRIVGSEPETKRFILRALRKKCRKIFEYRPGRIARAVSVRSRPPSFTGVTDKIARGLQQVGINRIIGRNRAVQVGGFTQTPMPLSGQDGRTRRSAGWR